MKINKVLLVSVLSVGVAAAPLAVLAESNPITTTSVNTGVSIGVKTDIDASGSGKKTDEDRTTMIQGRGGVEIENRITALNALTNRINNLRNLSDSQKAALSVALQSSISDLSNLKIKIDADGDSSSAKLDVQSITKAYRVYALVLPKAAVAAAADRALTIAGMLETVSAKLTTRLGSAPSSANATALADMNAKIADAKIQANAAISATANLAPDNGNQSVMSANVAALKDARTKIQAAQKDLIAARKDAGLILKSLQVSSSTTAGASATTNTQ